MKVFILNNVLCDYSCGCIIVAAKNKKEASEIIRENRAKTGLDCDDIEGELEEIGKGYYFELSGGG